MTAIHHSWTGSPNQNESRPAEMVYDASEPYGLEATEKTSAPEARVFKTLVVSL